MEDSQAGPTNGKIDFQSYFFPPYETFKGVSDTFDKKLCDMIFHKVLP